MRAVSAAVLLVGLLVVIWAASPGERRRRGVMEDVVPGDTAAVVVGLLGEPAARCSGVAHLRDAFPPGWPTAAVQTALQRLEAETAERWVYPVGRGTPDCAPADGRTEVGIDGRGRVLWTIPVTGRTPVRLPADMTPAAPDGTPARPQNPPAGR